VPLQYYTALANYDIAVFSRLVSLADVGATLNPGQDTFPSSVHHFGELYPLLSALLACYPENANDFWTCFQLLPR